jgi:hypothetical protein
MRSGSRCWTGERHEDKIVVALWLPTDVFTLWQYGNSTTCRCMPELKIPPSGHGQASDADEALDRQIAALRSSIERASHNGARGEPERVRTTTRSSGRLLRRASLLMHSRALEIRFYSFSVGLAVVVGWLIASKL